ncbi:nocturnin isoform X1 [Ahaetulla prasina]|uniref:nocturnin isoform X1 n=1 Tax=Ahaetulla prasina TaxID=499056 RepID=UPI00264854BB|nr:nocturnin isoform X1 [Ahaetulla prasina]
MLRVGGFPSPSLVLRSWKRRLRQCRQKGGTWGGGRLIVLLVLVFPFSAPSGVFRGLLLRLASFLPPQQRQPELFFRSAPLLRALKGRKDSAFGIDRAVRRALSPSALLASSSATAGVPRCSCPAPGSSGAGNSQAGYSMGNSTSRLYSALAKTLNSSVITKHQDYLEQTDPEFLDPIDPKDLLEECQIVLQNRPARLQRDFVDLRTSFVRNHQPIRIMQWNILAQALGEGKDNFIQCPMEALRWEERKCLILEEILAYQPDILCLQEVDHYFDTFQPLLSRLGYQCAFLPKPCSPCLDVECNNGPDGCALFFLKDRFTLINSTNIRLTAMKLKTNQVAIVQILKCNETGKLFCVAVTHLKARNGWETFRSAQGADLLENLKQITQDAEIPLIVCGDFNAEPTEEVYKQFSESSLNLNSAYKLLSTNGLTEPPYTTWKIRPSGECRHTLDYIWYSQQTLKVDAALTLLTEEQIGPNRLPSFNYPSDHLSLVCDFTFNENPEKFLGLSEI